MTTSPDTEPLLTRQHFGALLRAAGLHLPTAEVDNLFQGVAYIEAMIRRIDATRSTGESLDHAIKP
jgi:hypothetical protein